MTLLRVLVVLAGFIAAGVAFLPLRVVASYLPLQQSQVAYAAVSGSVWNGTVEGVTAQGEALGDFRVRTRFWPLLAGRLRVDFTSDGPLKAGQVATRGTGVMLLNLVGDIPLTRFAAAAPQDSRLSFRGAGLDLDGVRCKRAGGQATVTGLGPVGLGDLAGPLSCDAGRLVLSLAPVSGGPGADLVLDAAAQGRPRLTARSRDGVMQAALIALGIPPDEAPPT